MAALGARYLLLSTRSEVWTSLAVYADETVVGHVMWGVDDDGSHWIGGMLIDAAEQNRGVGRATVQTLAGWLSAREGNPRSASPTTRTTSRPPPSTPRWASTPPALWTTTR
ncbi:GNAT family N-acetyltransferase [Micromonospora sp. M12]